MWDSMISHWKNALKVLFGFVVFLSVYIIAVTTKFTAVIWVTIMLIVFLVYVSVVIYHVGKFFHLDRSIKHAYDRCYKEESKGDLSPKVLKIDSMTHCSKRTIRGSPMWMAPEVLSGKHGFASYVLDV